jgi:hypothetical protein
MWAIPGRGLNLTPYLLVFIKSGTLYSKPLQGYTEAQSSTGILTAANKREIKHGRFA